MPTELPPTPDVAAAFVFVFVVDSGVEATLSRAVAFVPAVADDDDAIFVVDVASMLAVAEVVVGATILDGADVSTVAPRPPPSELDIGCKLAVALLLVYGDDLVRWFVCCVDFEQYRYKLTDESNN